MAAELLTRSTTGVSANRQFLQAAGRPRIFDPWSSSPARRSSSRATRRGARSSASTSRGSSSSSSWRRSPRARRGSPTTRSTPGLVTLVAIVLLVVVLVAGYVKRLFTTYTISHAPPAHPARHHRSRRAADAHQPGAGRQHAPVGHPALPHVRGRELRHGGQRDFDFEFAGVAPPGGRRRGGPSCAARSGHAGAGGPVAEAGEARAALGGGRPAAHAGRAGLLAGAVVPVQRAALDGLVDRAEQRLRSASASVSSFAATAASRRRKYVRIAEV